MINWIFNVRQSYDDTLQVIIGLSNGHESVKLGTFHYLADLDDKNENAKLNMNGQKSDFIGWDYSPIPFDKIFVHDTDFTMADMVNYSARFMTMLIGRFEYNLKYCEGFITPNELITWLETFANSGVVVRE